jgi:hypothetical protein
VSEDNSETRAEFCAAERLSKSSFHKLKKLGLAPQEYVIPGTRIARITAEAHAAWRSRMANLAQSKAAKLEAERRREIAMTAGRLAAQSPKHVCRRGRKQAPKRKRRL